MKTFAVATTWAYIGKPGTHHTRLQVVRADTEEAAEGLAIRAGFRDLNKVNLLGEPCVVEVGPRPPEKVRVVVEDAGSKKIQGIKTIREALRLPLKDSKAVADGVDTPTLPREDAHALRAAILEASPDAVVRLDPVDP